MLKIFLMKMEIFMIWCTSHKNWLEKNNILCEYIMFRKAFKVYKEKFDCSYSKYVKINPYVFFYFETILQIQLTMLKVILIIHCKLIKSFKKPIYESRWRKVFNDTLCLWENVYVAKIK